MPGNGAYNTLENCLHVCLLKTIGTSEVKYFESHFLICKQWVQCGQSLYITASRLKHAQNPKVNRISFHFNYTSANQIMQDKEEV